MELLLILAVFGLLALAQSLLIGWLGLRGFSYERSFSRRDASPGDTVSFVEVIRNRSPLLLPWVRLETRIPPSFGFRTREEVDVQGRHYLRSVFSLMPYSQITRRHQVTVRRRGHYQLFQAAMTEGDLLGFRPISRDVDAPAEIYVYPPLLPPEEVPVLPTDPQGDVSVSRWIQPDPFLISGIRGYRSGDPERDIHWAATARTGELQVKVHDFTTNPGLLVLLNGQRWEQQWDRLMEEEQAPIEYGISLAATLCVEALTQGKEAGFATNMPLDEEEECSVLLPGMGSAEDLLRQMARLRVKCVRSFPTFLEEFPAVTGQDILILSCYEDEAIAVQAERLRSLGNSVTVLRMQEGTHA